MEDTISQQVTATSTLFLLPTDESPAKLEPIRISGNGWRCLRQKSEFQIQKYKTQMEFCMINDCGVRNHEKSVG